MNDYDQMSAAGVLGSIVGIGLGLFGFPFLLQWIWNLLAGQFGFNPISSYWVAFAIWLAISFVIGIIHNTIHGIPGQNR